MMEEEDLDEWTAELGWAQLLFRGSHQRIGEMVWEDSDKATLSRVHDT